MPAKRLISATIICLLILMAPITASVAQDPEQKLGNWIGVTSSMRFINKWSFFLQGEVRTWEMASNLNELLWRTAIHYDFNKKLNGAIGYVRVDTWPYENEPYLKFHENRFFQEFLIKSKWGNLNVKNRFRLEQRWITTVEYGTGYSNRIRYMLGFTIPLNGIKVGKGANYITVFNEVFIDFDRFDYWFDREAGESGLNQNRLYAGFGHQISDFGKLGVGLLWQHRPGVNFARLLVSYSHNFDFTKHD
jgi:hypothetical protein